MGAKDVFGFVGKVLDDNYRVDEAVGEGGFGVVYRGWHLGFDEPVAIKCLKLPAHFTDEARVVFEQRFRDEGKLLKRLGERHHAVVKAYDVRILKGQRVPYLVLEWLEGETLDRVMARRLADDTGPFGEAEVVKLLSPVIEALALAHRGDLGQVVAHRDIKPENLLMVQGGGVKILDFGIAKAMAEGEGVSEQASKTSSGFSAFSPSYGAPEQFSSKKYGESGPWTDVHALGLVLSYLVTGRKPYGEGDFSDFLLEALSSERPTPSRRGARVSDGFEALCARALSLKSAERFPTAGALLAALGGQVAERRGAMSSGAPVSHDAPRPAATRLPEMATFQPGAAVVSGERSSPKQVVSSSSRGEDVSTQLAGARTFEPGQREVEAESTTPVEASSGGGKTLGYGLGAVVVLVGALGYVVVKQGERPSETPPQASQLIVSTTYATKAAGGATGAGEAAGAAGSGKEEKGGAMVFIAGGSFQMGSDDGPDKEKPAHPVNVKGFWMDRTEVTVGAYRACRDAGDCSTNDLNKFSTCNWDVPGKDNHPINCVDLGQSEAFCKWAGKRLPTEPEWEYAARGGSSKGRKYAWGDEEPTAERACFRRKFEEGTCAVGAFPKGASKDGLQDMSGNVWEWTSTSYCKYDASVSVSCNDPSRVARGGGFNDDASSLRGLNRLAMAPKSYNSHQGFRCARTGR